MSQADTLQSHDNGSRIECQPFSSYYPKLLLYQYRLDSPTSSSEGRVNILDKHSSHRISPRTGETDRTAHARMLTTNHLGQEDIQACG
jgi:hypothetical protein